MSDFDGVSFNVFVDAADLNTMMVSTYMPSLPELMQYGAQVVLDDVYPGLTAPAPRPEFNLTLQFKIDALPWVAGKTADGPGGFDLTPEEAAAQEDFVLKISQLKRRLMGGPFDQCFAALTAGHAASLPPIQVHYRPNETVFIVPQVDRIVVVFSIDFPDRTDQAVARVFLQVRRRRPLAVDCSLVLSFFLSRSSTCSLTPTTLLVFPLAPLLVATTRYLQEFADVQRRVSGSTPVQFTRDEPLELKGVPGLTRSKNFVGYISFALFATHVEGDAKRSKAVTLIQGFRNYLHYHIKASKSYLHMRMRSRVVSLLQVLNRAVPDKPLGEKGEGKKTMSGKTFTRR